MDNVDKLKQRVADAAKVERFEETDLGKMVITWLNEEIRTRTERLVNDDTLDTNDAIRGSVRGELKAYRLIGEKLNLVKRKGVAAALTLEAQDIDLEDDKRSPEEIAQDASL